MKRPQFVFRPNLRDPAQRRAWQLLQAQPPGERSAYLAACILKADDRAAVQKELRKVLKEELGKIQVTAASATKTEEGGAQVNAGIFLCLAAGRPRIVLRVAADGTNYSQERILAFSK